MAGRGYDDSSYIGSTAILLPNFISRKVAKYRKELFAKGVAYTPKKTLRLFAPLRENEKILFMYFKHVCSHTPSPLRGTPPILRGERR